VWGRTEAYSGFLWENTREDLDMDRQIILKCILKKLDGGMDWINLAQDKDTWRAFVSTVMKVGVP
jgi:hypothetical protein